MTEPTHTPLPCPFCGGEAKTISPLGFGNVRAIECCNSDDCAATGPWACDEAEALTAWNTRADSHHRLVEALEDARTALSITRTNVMTEIGRCSDESRSPWAGVPEQLAKRIAKIDAALKEAGRG